MNIHQKDLTRSSVMTPFKAMSWNEIRCWRSWSKFLIWIRVSYNDTQNYAKLSMFKGIKEITWLAENLVSNGMEWIWLSKVETPDIFSQSPSSVYCSGCIRGPDAAHFQQKWVIFSAKEQVSFGVISFCPRWAEDMEALNSSFECWTSENCKRRNSEQYLFPLFLELIKSPWKRNIYFYSRLDSDKQKVFEENSLLRRKTDNSKRFLWTIFSLPWKQNTVSRMKHNFIKHNHR